MLATFLRGGDMFWVFYSYNPPRSARNWVNKEARDLEAHPGEDGASYATPRTWTS